MEHKKILQLPADPKEVIQLKAGDIVYLTGMLITGRDAAHKRLVQLIEKGQPLPVELCNQAIYYVGPCPAKPGQIIGSCGPTTSGRVDSYTPALLNLGLKVMIGKGQRSEAVVKSIVQNKAVYLAAVGGVGALLSKCIKKAEVIAFEDLGTEAIHRLYVEEFPTIVAIDAYGNNLYKNLSQLAGGYQF